MRIQQKTPGLPSIWGLLLVAGLAACGSDSPNGQTVTVNLSLIVASGQAHHQSIPLRFFAWIERWFPGATPAWAQQAVTDITRINVQISGPGIPVPATADVAVADPTSGQEIPVSIQAPVGPNRTIRVSAFNAENNQIFGGTLPNVNLTAGAPIDLLITLVRLFTVTVEKQGNGSGTVISTPPGIDCGPTCSGQFEVGTQVSLTAPAAAGSTFAGWAGDCSGMDACTLTGQASVIARFIVPVSTNHLHVDIAGPGTGTVSSAPSGISCAPSCDADFATDTLVTLTASAAAGSTFSNWSGGSCSGGTPTCTVAMNTNHSVTAIFNAGVPVPMSSLTVQRIGSGSGTVTSAPGGINCGGGGSCSASFPTGSTVTLTATPAAGSTLTGWSGNIPCGGSGPCVLTLTSDVTALPQFDLTSGPPDLVTLTVGKQGNGDGTVSSNPAGIFCGSACQFSF
ncbi:MAG TPA: hypothetical protein VG453_08620, partial [Nitrospira sp.]|nr:hypothetical protein [Nitrospira sp.]